MDMGTIIAALSGIVLSILGVLYFLYKPMIDGFFLSISKFISQITEANQTQQQQNGQNEWDNGSNQTQNQVNNNPDSGKKTDPTDPTSLN
jgi:uncharacterized protein YxeA